MTTTIHFNTKRQYTKHGQRITATLHDDGVVTFHDHDRMITGEFKMPENERFDQDTVMVHYDHNIAKQTARSHRDAFYADSVNGKYDGS